MRIAVASVVQVLTHVNFSHPTLMAPDWYADGDAKRNFRP
jgi:hypothetical protein